MIEEPFDILPLWKYAEDIDEAAEIGIDAGKRERKALLEEQRRKAEWTAGPNTAATGSSRSTGSGLSVASTLSSTPMSLLSADTAATRGGSNSSGNTVSDESKSSDVIDHGNSSTAASNSSSIDGAQASDIGKRRNPDTNAPPPPY
mmetsp:Transcript_14500/g.20131  ORF Transcript_14500/g.20131 Transcript_14500/m.20131 type:complete len:146 (+) Transcript_14500:116-553(+)